MTIQSSETTPTGAHATVRARRPEKWHIAKDLISWYIDNVVVPSGVSDPSQLLSEYKEVRNIVSHPIRRENARGCAGGGNRTYVADGAEMDPSIAS